LTKQKLRNPALPHLALALALAACAATAAPIFAQAPPQLSPATAQADQAQAPPAPAPAVVNPFPPVDPRNFTAVSPTRAEVDSFLKAIWGYDEGRIWSVAAIQKTAAPGVARVVVYVADKGQSGKGRQTVFFVTPDGKHAIADAVIDFGAKPFAEARQTLQARADGPAKGAAGKDLLLVEFVDLQDPRSRQAQETMTNLASDFPQARIVVEQLPATETHPFAMLAALYGSCVRTAKGDAAFFSFEQSVLDKQAGLTVADAGKTLTAAALAAGADEKTESACVESPAARAQVQAGIQLAADLGVDATPTLSVNGHMLQISPNLPYEVLRKIVAFQATQDGIPVHLQPLLTNLK
jgi:protein-disulfide isomerase